MIQVEQTKFGKKGNCMAACIASIFELPLSEVPECDGGAWNSALYNWFLEKNIGVCNHYIQDRAIYRQGYCILTARSPRTDGYHAVVALNGQIVWDPHPQREQGVGEWFSYTHFIVLDPSRLSPIVKRLN